MTQNHFNTNRTQKTLTVLCCLVLTALVLIFNFGACAKTDDTVTVWILCQPSDYVNVRATPSTKAEQVGFLDPCDEITIDVNAKNGFFPIVYPPFEREGYVSARYVSTEKPEWKNGELYAVCANVRVAARRWMDGPCIDWIVNGSKVQVFYYTPTWCVTNRGFIKTEYLEYAEVVE